MNWQSSTARIYATSDTTIDTTIDTVSDAALLDTHALIWYSVTPQKLSSPALEFIRKREHRIYVARAMILLRTTASWSEQHCGNLLQNPPCSGQQADASG